MPNIITIKKKKISVPQTISIPVYYYMDEEKGKVILDIDQMKDFFVDKLQELENQTHEL